MFRITFLVVIVVGLMLSYSCKKPDEYPVVPAISFKSIYATKDAQGYDDSIYVVISFTDGDGDLGLYPVESGMNDPKFDIPTGPYYNNFFATVFEQDNGIWDTLRINGLIIPKNSRIPYMTPNGANKALKGEILRKFEVPPFRSNDTVRYNIFIYDRALHQSNTVTTSAIVLTTR